MPAHRTSNVHLDILMGRDESLDTIDFMMPCTCTQHMRALRLVNGSTASDLRQPLDIHAEMEKKLRM